MTPAVQAVKAVLGPMTSEVKCRELVRAVLLAVRDRNEAMLDAGTAVLMPYVSAPRPLMLPGSTAVAVYEAMIDALLSEQE